MEVDVLPDGGVHQIVANQPRQPETRPVRRERKKRSETENFFSRNSTTGVRTCLLCKENPSVYSPNTASSNLRRHLETTHKEELLTMNRTGTTPEPCDRLLVDAMIAAGLPFKLLDVPAFREYIKSIQRQDYKLPTRRAFTEIYLPKRLGEIKAVISAKLRALAETGLSITFDSWTSAANCQYLAVTCQGVDARWRMQSFLLAVCVVGERETGAYVSRLVDSVLTEWSLCRENVVVVTTDGGSGIRNAVEKHLKLPWLHCMGHLINLAVKKGISVPAVDVLVKNARAISSHFRYSSEAARQLKDQQILLNQPVLCTKVSVVTRWNSVFDMIDRLLACRSSVVLCLSTARDPDLPELRGAEWESLEAIRDVLRPLKEVTTILSSASQPTAAAALVMFYNFAYNLTANVEQSSHGQTLAQQLAESAQAYLKKKLRQRMIPIPDAMKLAVYVDPRFKSFRFVRNESGLIGQAQRERLINETTGLVRAQLLIMLEPPSAATSAASVSTEEVLKKRRRLAEYYGSWTLDLSPADRPSISDHESAIASEIRAYNRLPDLNVASEETNGNNILAWWSANESHFPLLSKIARRYLSINATSVPSERVFSKGGWIVSKRRCSLSHENIASLMFLACNQQHIASV